MTNLQKLLDTIKETNWGPYNIIDLISKYNVELAIKLKEKVSEKGFYNGSTYWNLLISSILKAKIGQGKSINEIKMGMNEYILQMGYMNKPRADYYEQKFEVFWDIANSELYNEKDRKLAFNEAYQLVEYVNDNQIEYFLDDEEYDDLKHNYTQLCILYHMKINITIVRRKVHVKKSKMSEHEFIRKVRMAESKQTLNSLYKKLNDYNYGIRLYNSNSWEYLISKTYLMYNNIKPFLMLLKKNYFPSSHWYSSNSQFIHFGVGAAIKNINTREDMLEFLFNNPTGYAGFYNLIKTYEFLDDKDMCLGLFEKYINFCKFLVY